METGMVLASANKYLRSLCGMGILCSNEDLRPKAHNAMQYWCPSFAMLWWVYNDNCLKWLSIGFVHWLNLLISISIGYLVDRPHAVLTVFMTELMAMEHWSPAIFVYSDNVTREFAKGDNFCKNANKCGYLIVWPYLENTQTQEFFLFRW